MAGITTEERIQRRMAFYGVTRDTAISLLESEGGGDCIELDENGKRIMPDGWHEGRADHRREVRAMADAT